MTNHNDIGGTKTIRIPCKQCGKEFDFVVALRFYEAAIEAAEGDPVVFTGTCPECRTETTNPLLQLMNKVQGPINEDDRPARIDPHASYSRSDRERVVRK
jgi:hypothetical protein